MEPGQGLIEELAPQVRLNCQRSDAEVSGRFSLCGLLLRMRNLYKWEQDLPPWREDEPARVLDWVSAREELWLDLLGQEPQPLRLAGRTFDPFDSQGLNALLEPAGLVYGAGLAGGLLPVFFLGRLLAKSTEDGLTVFRLGEELGRDLFFLPGLRQEASVFLRRGPLGYLLWDKLADPRPSVRRFVELGLRGYGLDLGELLRQPSWEALEPVLAGEMEAVLWHEMGEAQCGDQARELLHLALAEHAGTELEHFARGVKDLLADACPQGRLHQIIARRAVGPLGFYPAWLAGFPRLLFPEIDAAVLAFRQDGDWGVVEEARQTAWARAQEARQRLAAILGQEGPARQARLAARREVIEPLTGGRGLPKLSE